MEVQAGLVLDLKEGVKQISFNGILLSCLVIYSLSPSREDHLVGGDMYLYFVSKLLWYLSFYGVTLSEIQCYCC